MLYFIRLALPVLLFLAKPRFAESQFDEGNNHVKTTLIQDMSAIVQENHGDTPAMRIGVFFNIEPGWHIYWKNSGESAIPTSITFKLPNDWQTSELNWPAPYRFLERGDITTYGYKDEVLLIADLFAPADIPLQRQLIPVEAQVKFLVCNDICVPGQITLYGEIPFGPEEQQGPSKHYELFNHYARMTPQAVLSLGKTLLQEVSAPIVGNDNNAEIYLNLDKTQFKNPETLAANLQIFPIKHPNFSFSEVALLQSDTQLQLRLRYKSAKAATPSDSLTGSLVINADSLRSPNKFKNSPISIDWKSGTSQQPFLTQQGSELTYRFISYQHNQGPEEEAKLASATETSVLFALLFGFLAGVVLNFMPCVLPIISIKVLSFISHANRPRSYVLTSAAFYSAGILATFLTLAMLLLSLRSVGAHLGWGFQFQYPAFVISLSIIVFVLALGFFDLFHFTLPYLQRANRGVAKLGEGHSRTFFDGILATLLSTPCTAPFLGTALAFSFTASPLEVIVVFLAIGLGLAFPYILLSLNKKLIGFLPKPGDWMYRVRELMGFFLLATVIWLLYVLSKLTADGATWMLVLLLLIFVGFWFTGKTKASRKQLVQWTFVTVTVICGATFWPQLTTSRQQRELEHGSIKWLPYSPETLQQQLDANKTVFIDFTAEWCITCKANEKLVIASDDVVKAINNLGIVMLKADWTSADPVVSKALAEYGGNGVPLYVVVSKKKETVLPTLLTPSSLINALYEAQPYE